MGMNERQLLIAKNVDSNKQMIYDAEKWLWAHPQTGYTEWEAHGYAKELFEMSDIDGGLVGGASLKAEEFSKIVNFDAKYNRNCLIKCKTESLILYPHILK